MSADGPILETLQKANRLQYDAQMFDSAENQGILQNLNTAAACEGLLKERENVLRYGKISDVQQLDAYIRECQTNYQTTLTKESGKLLMIPEFKNDQERMDWYKKYGIKVEPKNQQVQEKIQEPGVTNPVYVTYANNVPTNFQEPEKKTNELSKKNLLYSYFPLYSISKNFIRSNTYQNYEADYTTLIIVSLFAFIVAYYDHKDCEINERLLKSFIAAMFGMLYIIIYLIKYAINTDCKKNIFRN